MGRQPATYRPIDPPRFLSDPKVEVQLHVRRNKTWFWRVRVFARPMRKVGTDWCSVIDFRDVEGSVENVQRQIAITAGAIAEWQGETKGVGFEPSEVAALGVEAYRELCADLERRHGDRVPRLGLRGEG